MPDGDPARSLVVVVTDQSPRGLRLPGLAAWLQGVAPARARGVVSLALVSDRVVRRLNRQYAGNDTPTDVLSFPAGGPRGGAPFLGDIVVATGVARRQARDAGHSVGDEVKTLALHGLLHLLGYDHHADGGRMARLEARLRRKGGLREGLIERARRA
jgi:probable rRNA maturation factor